MTNGKRIDDCLSTRDGHLYIEGCDAVDLVSQFGSPLSVMSEDQLRRNVRRYQKAWQVCWPEGEVKVMPAVKANWLAAVQRIVALEGCGADIYSPGEFAVVLRAGIPPEWISVNGLPKGESHIANAIREGARITLDGAEELDVVERLAQESGRKVKVRLRLRPTLRYTRHSEFAHQGLVPTDIADQVYKAGLSFDTAVAQGKRILESPNLELVGFHQHRGRHSRRLDFWEDQMRTFAEEIGRVSRAIGGYQPVEIDIGGGFAERRDPFAAMTDYMEPLQLAALHGVSAATKVLGESIRQRVLNALIEPKVMKPSTVHAPTVEQYAETCTRVLRQRLPRNGIGTKGLMLQIEPGRAMFGDAGVHLTTVTNLKRQTCPFAWQHVVVDSTVFWITSGRFETYLHSYIFANKTDAPMEDKADIDGRSCHGEDRMLPMVRVPKVELGDIIALLDTGAYMEGSASNFNALPRPATVLVTGDRSTVIRRAESVEDVLQRDEIPPHLETGKRERMAGEAVG